MSDDKCRVATCTVGTGEVRIFDELEPGRDRRKLLHIKQFSNYGQAVSFAQEFNVNERAANMRSGGKR